MKEAICKEFCNQLRVKSVPAGLAVGTSFIGPDGDAIGFYVIGPDHSGQFHIEDSGATVPILEASGADLELASRLQAFTELLSQYEVAYDLESGGLSTASLSEREVPRAALRFVAFLLRLQDLLLMTRERAESTFRDDALREIQRTIGARAEVKTDAVISDALSDFKADIIIRAPNRDPVAVFLVMADAKLYEAMLVQTEADTKAQTPCKVVALLERDTSVSQRAFKQAMNRLTPLRYRDDQENALKRIEREALGIQRMH